MLFAEQGLFRILAESHKTFELVQTMKILVEIKLRTFITTKMADAPNFLFLIQALRNDEERHNLFVLRREMLDISDPFSIPEGTFRGIFRLSRTLALDLIEELRPHLVPPEREELAIPIHLKVLVALNIYGHGSYQKSTAANHLAPMCQASVSRALQEVTAAINNHLAHKISFPVTEEQRLQEKQKFMQMNNGFPGIIGVIDCTHVAIQAPPTDDEHFPGLAFLNRKGYYSLNVQIIVNAQLKILALNARFPGSVHDFAIWMVSRVKQHLVQNFNEGDHSSWLLGDSGYGLEPWLMTPFSNMNNLDERQQSFNRAHKSVRNVVERLNGVLKARFRCLLKHRTLHYHPQAAGLIVNACGILHNICMERGEIENLDPDIHENRDNRDHIQQHDRRWLQEGQATRKRIVNNYF